MPNAFDSPRRKIEWAKHHLSKVKRVVRRYLRQDDLYSLFPEPDAKNPQHTVCKLRIVKHPPWFLDDMVSDVVTNLRSALDHAIYAASSAAGVTKKFRYALFPFGYTQKSFEKSLCGNSSDVPPEIRPLIRSYKPYKGGDDALWALHRIRCTNEHAIIVPTGSAVYNPGSSLTADGFVSVPYNPSWDRAKNEMVLFTIARGVKLQGNFQFAFRIEFGEIESVAEESLVPTLDLFVNMVETIIDEIEAETRRLGFRADL